MKPGWTIAALGDVAEVVSGATPKTGVKEFWDGDIPWATPKDLSSLSVAEIQDTPRTITGAGLRSCAASVLPAGSVLFSSRAPIGHVAINTVPMATNQGFKSLIPKPGILDAKYLYHWLRWSRAYLESLGNGATFKEVSKAVVSRVELPLPPIEEQRRIAAILDGVAELRTRQERRRRLLGLLPKAVFDDKVDASWPESSIGQHLTFVTSGGRGWAKYYAKKGSRFIRSLDVREGYLSDRELAFVAAPDNAEARRTCVQEGDVLLTITGSRIGRSAPVTRDWAGGYVSQHVAILRPNTKTLRTEYLALLLRLPVGRRLISEAQYGQTKPGLNFSQVRGFRLPIPDVQAQEALLRSLGGVTKAAARCDSLDSELSSLYESLQARAFSGRL